jgi:hypothetical protein
VLILGPPHSPQDAPVPKQRVRDAEKYPKIAAPKGADRALELARGTPAVPPLHQSGMAALVRKRPAASPRAPGKAVPAEETPPPKKRLDVASWEARHAHILAALPAAARPQNDQHGEKSWTIKGSTQCRIEVLIGGKTAAFMVKPLAGPNSVMWMCMHMLSNTRNVLCHTACDQPLMYTVHM